MIEHYQYLFLKMYFVLLEEMGVVKQDLSENYRKQYSRILLKLQ